MKRLFLCLLIFSIVLSCSESDNSENQNNSSTENFYALTVGNSWVYKNYKYDINSETYEDTGVVDEISIIGTQEISGETYFVFRRLTTGNEEGITLCNENGEHFEFLRESNGNLINEEGQIKFTNNNYEERLLKEYQWGNLHETLVEGYTDISVEAGEFTCINSERYLINNEDVRQPGLDRFYYANGYGLIYDTSSYITLDRPTIIRRLDSYVIQ